MNAAAPMDQWARQWRGPMLRFARLHIQPLEDAEDAVQDALAALWSSPAERLNSSDVRPYLFGILKHKITDRLRSKYRHAATGTADGAGGLVHATDADELDAELFDANGHWQAGAAPARWSCPESTLHNEQFFAVVDACVNRLPAKAARVFSMKELLECDTDEVCSTLGLSKADYWQCMSRARKQLQLCLNQHWFAGVAP